jgi:hypothetical protein
MEFHGGDGDGQLLSAPVTTRVDNGQVAQFLEVILAGESEALSVFD